MLLCPQLPLDTLVFMLNRFTADDFSKEGIPAGEGHTHTERECGGVQQGVDPGKGGQGS